jgi:hypothetical protein
MLVVLGIARELALLQGFQPTSVDEDGGIVQQDRYSTLNGTSGDAGSTAWVSSRNS